MGKVAPGRFRLRGMFLFELYVVSLFLLKKEGADMSVEERLKELEGMRDQLEESVEILSWEPPDSMEGHRCAMARQYLKSLESMIGQCQQAVLSKAASVNGKGSDGGGKVHNKKKG